MKFIGILLLDALLLAALFFSQSSTFKSKSAGSVIGTYFLGLILTYAWSIGIYYSILLIVRG